LAPKFLKLKLFALKHISLEIKGTLFKLLKKLFLSHIELIVSF